MASIHTQALLSNALSHPAALFWHEHTQALASIANSRDEDGCTPLMYAVIGKHDAQVQALLQRGTEVTAVDINAADNTGKTALHYAVMRGDARLVKTLLSHDATSRPDHNAYTPLMLAALFGHVEIARLLLSHGADTAPQDRSGRNAATLAKRAGNLRIFTLLSR